MTKPLALTDAQLAIVRSAPAKLRPSARNLFMRCIANSLTATPSDADVRETIATIFSITKSGAKETTNA
jgi:hypothetical protein